MADVLLASDDVPAAVVHARVALGLRRRLALEAPATAAPDARRGLARAVELVADALGSTGDYSSSLEAQREATALRENLSRLPGASIADRRDLGILYGKLGRILVADG